MGELELSITYTWARKDDYMLSTLRAHICLGHRRKTLSCLQKSTDNFVLFCFNFFFFFTIINSFFPF